jgi:soluble lytic murein transglycosylase-like protein
MLINILLVLALSRTTTPVVVLPPADEPKQIVLTIEDKIRIAATVHGVDPDLSVKIAKCESGLNPTVYGDSGKAYGLYQFHRGTFEMFAKEAGLELDYYNPEHQIILANWAFAQGYYSHWTCARMV